MLFKLKSNPAFRTQRRSLAGDRRGSEIHIHIPVMVVAAHRLNPIVQVSNHRLHGDEETRYGGRRLKRCAHNLGRIDDALGHEVAILPGPGVVTISVGVLRQDLADYQRAVVAGIGRDLTSWPKERPPDDTDSVRLTLIDDLDVLQRTAGAKQGDAAPRQNAFLDRGPHRMQRIVDAVLSLPDLKFASAANPDHCDAARQLGDPLLQLFKIVIGCRLVDLGFDFLDARLDLGLVAAPFYDRDAVLCR